MAAPTNYTNKIFNNGLQIDEANARFDGCTIRGNLYGHNVTLIDCRVKGDIYAAHIILFNSTVNGDIAANQVDHHSSNLNGVLLPENGTINELNDKDLEELDIDSTVRRTTIIFGAGAATLHEAIGDGRSSESTQVIQRKLFTF